MLKNYANYYTYVPYYIISFIKLKIMEKNYNILWFCFICIQLNSQNLQTSVCTYAAPDARFFSHLVKFKKKVLF